MMIAGMVRRSALRRAFFIAAVSGVATSALCVGLANAALETTPRVSKGQVNPPGLGPLLRQARQAMVQGQPRLAIIYLKNAADLAPQNGEVHAELGVALLGSGDAGSAERELRTARHFGMPDAKLLPFLFDSMLRRGEQQQLLNEFPPPAQNDHSPTASIVLSARAIALARAGQNQLAVAALEQALSFDRSAGILAERAQLAYAVGDRVLAEKLTDEALSKTPNRLDALMLKIALLQQSKQGNQALNVADMAVKYYPTDPRALMTRVGVYLQLNQDAKAGGDVDKILAAHPGFPEAVYYKAILRERAKDLQGAWSLAQSLPTDYVRSSAKIGLSVAQMAANAGHLEVGAATVSAIVVKFPDNADARVRLASLYIQLKDAPRALETLQPMQGSQDPRALVLLGEAYALEKQFGKSTEYFEQASAAGFGGDALKREIAKSSLQSGNLDTAIPEYQALNAKDPARPEIAGPLIAALLRKGDATAARGVADRFAAAAPQNPLGPLFQGQLLMAGGDFGGAVSKFSRAASINPKFIPALYGRALANTQRGEIEAANGDLHAILAMDPKNVLVLIKYAENEARLGQAQQSLHLLQQAVTLNPKDVAANVALANFFLAQHRTNEAAAVIARFLKAVPGNATALLLRGQIELAQGTPDQAVATFQVLEKQYPQSAQVEILLAKGLAAKKDLNGAMSGFGKAVQLAPTSASPRAELIRFALATNNQDAALTTARDYVARSPGAEADALLAGTLIALKRTDEAEAVLTRSVAEHPSSATVIGLSQILRQSGTSSKADALLNNWLNTHPNDLAVRLEYAQASMATNPSVAEGQFRIVLNTQPYNIIALNNLSWLLKDKSPKAALPYAEQAAKLAPNSASILDTLGAVRLQLKDNAGALSLLQRAHQIDQADPEIAYHWVVALNGAGHRDEAKKNLDVLLSNKRNFPDLQSALALSGQWH